MKKFVQVASFALVAAMFSACGSDIKPAPAAMSDVSNIDGTRGVKQVKFQGQTISIAAADEIIVRQQQANADAEVAKSIFNSLQAAQKSAEALEVQITLSEEKVEDGMLVFSLDTDNAQKLTMELFDEEGYGMAGSNALSLNAGKNYKAINVNALENGKYIMRLSDAEGKEKIQNFEVAKQ